MKTLTLLRHAKAGWGERGSPDFDRPLNDKGRRAARAMGRAMRDAELGWDLVVASPAARVTETLEGASEGYGAAFDPVWDRRAYLAAPEVLMEIVQATHDAVGTLLIVGHNPGLELLTLQLTSEEDGGELRAAVLEKYPTGTLAEIHLPVDRWRDAGEGKGTLRRFLRPRDLDAALGPDGD